MLNLKNIKLITFSYDINSLVKRIVEAQVEGESIRGRYRLSLLQMIQDSKRDLYYKRMRNAEDTRRLKGYCQLIEELKL